MAKRFKKIDKGDSTPVVKHANKAYPVEQEDLEEQQQRLRKAAAAGADALKRPITAETTTPEPEPPLPAKPLAPLGALWPNTTAPAEQTAPPVKPSGAQQVQAVQKSPTSALAPAAVSPASRPAATRPTQKTTAIPAAQKTTVPQPVKVTFALRAQAKQVALCGQFNGWSPNATPLQLQKDGRWEVTLALPPGKHEYKFVVDGQWITDPTAQNSVRNQYGSLNSVVEVRA